MRSCIKERPASWLLYALLLALPLFSVEPKLLKPDWWIGALLILRFGFAAILKGKVRLDSIGKAALGLNVAVLLSVLVNFWSWEGRNWAEFGTLWLQLVFATLLYLAMANLEISLTQLSSLLRFWISVAVIVSVYGLYQVPARNFGWPLAYIYNLHGEPTVWSLQWGLGFAGYIRPSSFLREPTYLSNYLLPPMLITGAMLFYRQDQNWLFRRRFMNCFALIIIFSAWIAAFAMAGYLSLAITLVIATLLTYRVWKLRSLRLVLAFLTSSLFAYIVFVWLKLPFIEALAERGKAIASVVFGYEWTHRDPSVIARFHELALSFKLWMHYPLFGIGLNQLQFVGEQHLPENWPANLNIGYIHNMWLEVLVQTGFFGFLFFLRMWVCGLKMMYCVSLEKSNHIRGLGLGVFFVILVNMILGFMGHPFIFIGYWFYLWLASAIYHLSRKDVIEPRCDQVN